MAGNDKQIMARLVKRMKNRDADPLRPLLDEYLIQRELQPPEKRYPEHRFPLISRPRPAGRLSPSTIGGCKRQAAFKFLGVGGRRHLDPDLEAIFDDGNWRHHRWQATFRDMQAVLGPHKIRVRNIEKGVRFPELCIAGNSDIELAIERKTGVLDIKGISDYGFTKIYADDEPKDEHVSQLTSYLACHEREIGWLHYDNKNDQRTRTFVVRFDEERWEWIKEWCWSVLKMLSKRRIPPMHADCEAGNFLYEKCPWSYICYGRKSVQEIEAEVFLGFPGVRRAYRNSFKETA